MMSTTLAPQIAILCFMLLGALQVLGPDRWMPASVLAWQKGWKVPKTVFFSVCAFFSHVLTGYLLFLFFQRGMNDRNPAELFLFALILMGVLMVFRSARFSKVREVFKMGHRGARGNLEVLSLLGPCEVALPVFAKAKFLGIGYLIPFGAFLLGTWIAGIVLVVLGQIAWNRPSGLPLGIHWAQRRRAVLPMFAGLVLNLGLLYLW